MSRGEGGGRPPLEHGMTIFIRQGPDSLSQSDRKRWEYISRLMKEKDARPEIYHELATSAVLITSKLTKAVMDAEGVDRQSAQVLATFIRLCRDLMKDYPDVEGEAPMDRALKKAEDAQREDWSIRK